MAETHNLLDGKLATSEPTRHRYGTKYPARPDDSQVLTTLPEVPLAKRLRSALKDVRRAGSVDRALELFAAPGREDRQGSPSRLENGSRRLESGSGRLERQELLRVSDRSGRQEKRMEYEGSAYVGGQVGPGGHDVLMGHMGHSSGGRLQDEQAGRHGRDPWLSTNATYPTPEEIAAILRHVKRLEATNESLHRQVRSSPTYSVSRAPSPLPQYGNQIPSSLTPVVYSVVSKKPPPSTHFNFPPVTPTGDKLLRQKSAYVVFQDLFTGRYVPDNTKRKQPGDPSTGHLVIVDLPSWQDAGIIRGLASRKPDVRFLLEDDQRFRQKMALPDSDVTGWYPEDRDIVKAVNNSFKPTATTATVISTVARGPYSEWIRTATCHICSEKGHIAKTCPSKKEGVNTSSNRFSNMQSDGSNSNSDGNRPKAVVLACSRFNEPGGCAEPCYQNYAHNCLQCLKPGHTKLTHRCA
ncbi:hypothetical protein RvY_03660 [Ramazzottius varieornatus]|uniref:CCHC-type domain-containing protein n=1 Tax=Ramazzottius varieornatus TaxID=947166 RepID=A0A1D1UUI7_RAMVA|nr:hypothetical protein RvY_03660 [Ramazzottius varieornatus]